MPPNKSRAEEVPVIKMKNVYPWDTVGIEIFMLNNITYFCIVDYQSIFPVVKLTDGLGADSLIKTCMIASVEYRLPRKIMSDCVTNFVSENFQELSISIQPFIIRYQTEQCTNRSMYTAFEILNEEMF